MSKSGIVYHFPSRYEIMRGIHQHLADQWEEGLEGAARGQAHIVDDKTRLRAMLVSQNNSVTKAELLLEIDARSNPEFSAIRAELNDRWMPAADGVEDDDALRSRYLVKVLADGLWMQDHVHKQAQTPAQRDALTDQILQMWE